MSDPELLTVRFFPEREDPQLLPYEIIDGYTGAVVATFAQEEHAMRWLFLRPFLISGIDAVPAKFRSLYQTSGDYSDYKTLWMGERELATLEDKMLADTITEKMALPVYLSESGVRHQTIWSGLPAILGSARWYRTARYGIGWSGDHGPGIPAQYFAWFRGFIISLQYSQGIKLHWGR